MRIASIHIHPLKGARAVDLGAVYLEPWGPRGDRRWLVVDGNNRFVSQRETPLLAIVVVRLTAGRLELSAPGLGLAEAALPGPNAPRLTVSIFKDLVDAAAVDGPVNDWLSRLGGEPWRLVYMDAPSAARPVPKGGVVSFADEHPVLLTSTASLDAFNAAAGLSTPMERFRPNLVIEGGPPWEEDDWARIAIGAAEFEVVGACGRCTVPTVDQKTGAKAVDAEPLRSLSQLRRRGPGAPLFGVHLRPVRLGRVCLGDELRVLG